MVTAFASLLVVLATASGYSGSSESSSFTGEQTTPTEQTITEVGHLANDICSRASLAHNTGSQPVHDVFRIVILNYLGLAVPLDSEESRAAVTEFWNEYGSYMICTEKLVGLPTPQHFLKRVVELDATSNFYFGYFLKDRTREINFVEIVDGKPETLLDFIDKVLADPDAEDHFNVVETRQLRSFITQVMDAKTAAEMLGSQ